MTETMSRSRTLARTLIVAGAAGVITTACAAFPRTYAGDGVRVHVHNESWSAVDVRATVAGEVVELGSIHPDDYPFFDLALPNAAPAEVVLVATSHRDGRLRTDTLAVEPGAVVQLFLDRRWSRSSWSKR